MLCYKSLIFLLLFLVLLCTYNVYVCLRRSFVGYFVVFCFLAYHTERFLVSWKSFNYNYNYTLIIKLKLFLKNFNLERHVALTSFSSFVIYLAFKTILVGSKETEENLDLMRKSLIVEGFLLIWLFLKFISFFNGAFSQK